MSIKSIIVYISISVTFFITGFYLNNFINSEKQILSCGDDYQKGWQAAENRFIEVNNYNNSSEIVSTNIITGTIVSKDSNQFSLKLFPLSPLGDPGLDERIVSIDVNTKILLYSEKNNEEYLSEVQKYQKNFNSNSGEEAYIKSQPSPFNIQEITFDDLSSGLFVTVESGENIAQKKAILATKITAKK